MKPASKDQKTPNSPAHRPEPSTGPDGLAISPPAHKGASEANTGLTVQSKMTVTSASDATEQEADQIAQEVLKGFRRPAPKPFQPKISAQPAPPTGRILPKLQAPHGFNGGEISGEIAAGIQQAKGGGNPLQESEREKMGRAFGVDFSGVRIHTNPQADTLNRSLQARAFTAGKDIFFRQGEYHPKSDKGQLLIAHELTHVIQQGAESSATVNRSSAQGIIQRAVFIGDPMKIKTPSNIRKIKTELKKLRYELTEQMENKLQKLVDAKSSYRFPDYAALVDELKKEDEAKYYLKIGLKDKEESVEVADVLNKLYAGSRINDGNFPGLKNELIALSKAGQPITSIDELTTYLRTKIWNPALGPGAKASLDEQEHPKQLLQEMQKLKTSGLKYTKPRAAFTLQNDFWQKPDIAPHILNCWETVLLAGYRQGLIDHKTFVLADEIVASRDGANVMSEAVYQASGENKIEWAVGKDPSAAAKDAMARMNAVVIPEGWVIVVGRNGFHVGVSTGNKRAPDDSDTKDVMKTMESPGHEWIENNTRVGKDLPVSDLRVSTLEDTIMQFQNAGGIYWSPLPREFADYLKAKSFLESLKV